MGSLNSISEIADRLKETKEGEIIAFMDQAYKNLFDEQKKFYDQSEFSCPDSCGCCCHNFEPDLLESEALYMAAFLITNQKETADKLAAGFKDHFFQMDPDQNITDKTCIFFNKDSGYHCSIYNGRPMICRLFGANSFKDKKGDTCWKPCKFYPQEKLASYKIPLSHRQYHKDELLQAFGVMPPVMSDVMEQVINHLPGRTETYPLREILPQTIRKLYWLLSLTGDII